MACMFVMPLSGCSDPAPLPQPYTEDEKAIESMQEPVAQESHYELPREPERDSDSDDGFDWGAAAIGFVAAEVIDDVFDSDDKHRSKYKSNINGSAYNKSIAPTPSSIGKPVTKPVSSIGKPVTVPASSISKPVSSIGKPVTKTTSSIGKPVTATKSNTRSLNKSTLKKKKKGLKKAKKKRIKKRRVSKRRSSKRR